MPVDAGADARAAAQRARRAAERYHAANAAAGKLFARERIALLVDEGSFVEDGLFANVAGRRPAGRRRHHRHRHHRRPAGLPDGQRLHGQGRLLGRPYRREDHPDHRAGLRRPACRWSTWSTRPAPGSPTRSTSSPAAAAPGASSTTRSAPPAAIPQVCALFGPSAAGGAYIPAFCDVVAMVEGNASMYLGSDRMVEMVTGEKTTLEAMGGARVHCAESGVGHFLCKTEAEALDVGPALPVLPAVQLDAARRRSAGRGAPPTGPRRAGPGQRAAGLRHAPVRQGRWSTRARSSRSRRCGRAS